MATRSGTLTYTVNVGHAGKSYDLGSVEIPPDATPKQANREVAALLRRIADELEAEHGSG